MKRDDIVKALRCCTSTPNYERCAAECSFCRGSDVSKCIPNMGQMAADLLENDAKALNALTLENAALRATTQKTEEEAQQEHVVRCVDCKYLEKIDEGDFYAQCRKSYMVFRRFGVDTRGHFCSLGERKDISDEN